MLGILYGIIGITGVIGSGIKDSIYDTKTRKRQLSDGKLFFRRSNGTKQKYWTDHRGLDRLEGSNRIIVFREDWKTGDQLVVDYRTGKVIENLSQNTRNKYQQECREIAIKNGRTVYPLEKEVPSWRDDYKTLSGRKYKDINTGEIYVCRVIGSDAWYIRATDGLFIKRVWDESTDLSNIKIYNEETIEQINERQRKKCNRYIGRKVDYDAWKYPITVKSFSEAREYDKRMNE